MMSRLSVGVAALLLSVNASSGADITVGFVTSLSGPGASIGIPYEKGVIAGHAYAGKVGDVNIKLIRLDDASDPSAATRNARKLVEEDKVDVLMGTSGVPGTIAMAASSVLGFGSTSMSASSASAATVAMAITGIAATA